MRIFRIVMIPALAALAVCLVAAATPPEEASAAGEKWLALLDGGKYEESWTEAGAMFREQVMKEQWVSALRRSRQPLGPPVSRTSGRVDFSSTLRGAPDGEYAVIHYTTKLESKTITERLTMVKENGKWMASAYAIH